MKYYLNGEWYLESFANRLSRRRDGELYVVKRKEA